MREFMAITKALADQNRVRLLLVLEHGELCVCQLIEFINLAPSTVSKHLSILKNAYLVEARKEGRWMFYRLPDEDISPAVRGALAWVRAALAEEVQARQDKERIQQVLKVDPEELCRKQCCR